MGNEELTARRVVVIADDITGAAEIAGIAFEHGQQVSLVCGTACSTACGSGAAAPLPCRGEVGGGVSNSTVIATDTRSMTEAEAVAETRRIARSFLISHSSFLIFKKTDSALRGHVVAELTALMEATGYRRAVYLPANPSKGRVIRNGTYYIIKESGVRSQETAVPIHETAFSYDPEFPAKTSVLKERFPEAEAAGIIMPDAVSEDDIRQVIATYDDGNTLFAGAADLFAAVIGGSGSPEDSGSPGCSGDSGLSGCSGVSGPSTLILCGSTQSRPLELGIPISPMPREVYDGSTDLALWNTEEYAKGGSMILTIPHSHRTGKEIAVHLRTVMAEMTRRLVAEHRPDHLIIEGGATAWATLQALGWTQFEIRRQVAPGVVQMSATNGTLVTLKPGSYPWGSLFG